MAVRASDAFPCGICHKKILDHHKSILCDCCNHWVHIHCYNVTVKEYKELQKEPENVPCFCLKCTAIMFPFGSLDNVELSNLNEFDFPSFIDSAPSFEITSYLTNLPNL